MSWPTALVYKGIDHSNVSLIDIIISYSKSSADSVSEGGICPEKMDAATFWAL